MVNYQKPSTPRTTIWKNEGTSRVLVRSFDGLPFNTDQRIVIAGLGQATRCGLVMGGSGGNEYVREVQYVLD
jgi:uncharacterized membrane protein